MAGGKYKFVAVLVITLAWVSAVSAGDLTWVSDSLMVDCAANFGQDCELAAAGIDRQLAQPDVTIWSPEADSSLYIPAVPSAVLLGLTGFLCVTMVRDRKFWLFLAVGAVSLSCTGLHSATKLVSNARTVDSKLSPAQASEISGRFAEDALRTRADIEGSTYIALLHYLQGLPARVCGYARPFRITTYSAGSGIYNQPVLAFFTHYADSASQCRRRNTSLFNRQANADPAFWPGFSFEVLAHGPPLRS